MASPKLLAYQRREYSLDRHASRITVVSIIRFSGLIQYSTTTNPTCAYQKGTERKHPFACPQRLLFTCPTLSMVKSTVLAGRKLTVPSLRQQRHGRYLQRSRVQRVHHVLLHAFATLLPPSRLPRDLWQHQPDHRLQSPQLRQRQVSLPRQGDPKERYPFGVLHASRRGLGCCGVDGCGRGQAKTVPQLVGRFWRTGSGGDKKGEKKPPKHHYRKPMHLESVVWTSTTKTRTKLQPDQSTLWTQLKPSLGVYVDKTLRYSTLQKAILSIRHIHHPMTTPHRTPPDRLLFLCCLLHDWHHF